MYFMVFNLSIGVVKSFTLFKTDINRSLRTRRYSLNDERTHLSDFISPISSSDINFRRRTILIGIFSGIGVSSPISAAPIKTSEKQDSFKLQDGLLESRVIENLMNPPSYGLESKDIFYPSYFNGVWKSVSITTEIQAPCGVMLFGGNNTYTRAQLEIGPQNGLNYNCRFIKDQGGQIIADRGYNVREIAKAAMGKDAVLDIPVVTPNKVSVVLSPSGAAGRVMQADLITLNRRQESVGPMQFHCSEVVRQIVATSNEMKPTNSMNLPNGSKNDRAPLLKEVETICLYTAIAKDDGEIIKIKCKQRCATFILPSQQDPVTYQMWQMTKGRPIDVRFYDVVYTKQ